MDDLGIPAFAGQVLPALHLEVLEFFEQPPSHFFNGLLDGYARPYVQNLSRSSFC